MEKNKKPQGIKISPQVAGKTRRAKTILTPERIKEIYAPCNTRGFAGNSEIREKQNTALDSGGIYDMISCSDFHYMQMIPRFIGYGALVNLTQNGLIHSGIEMRADEMTRKWIELSYRESTTAQNEETLKKTDSEQEQRISSIKTQITKYKLKKLFRHAACSCGYYGGCLMYIDTGDLSDNELRTPLTLDEELFQKGSLRGFKIIEPFDVAPGYYNTSNPISQNYFKPEYWYILGKEIHASRFIYFTENEVPTWLQPSYNFFGIPLAQTVLDVVKHFSECREAEARLLKKFSLTVMKTDLQQLLTGGDDTDIEHRIEYFVQKCDNDGLMVIDFNTENIEKIETSIKGVTDIVAQAMEMVAAYFGEPVVKLWGISPSGFNATGESDMRNHYDHIASIQDKIYSDPLEKLLKLLQLNEFGNIDEALTYSYIPLGEGNDKKVAELNNIKAHSDVLLYKSGLISNEEVRRRISQDPQSYYSDINPEQTPPPIETNGENPLKSDYYDKDSTQNKYNIGAFTG